MVGGNHDAIAKQAIALIQQRKLMQMSMGIAACTWWVHVQNQHSGGAR